MRERIVEASAQNRVRIEKPCYGPLVDRFEKCSGVREDQTTGSPVNFRMHSEVVLK
jgi:hypothetical protein